TLRNLLYGNSPLSYKFWDGICQYNNALAFTSVGVKVDHAVTQGSGPYCFKINGELHHNMGSLVPPAGEQPQFAQLWVHDPALALSIRQKRNPNLHPMIIT